MTTKSYEKAIRMVNDSYDDITRTATLVSKFWCNETKNIETSIISGKVYGIACALGRTSKVQFVSLTID